MFGLNVWLWALLGLTMSAPDERFHVVRLCISEIHLVVGVLFLIRRPLVRSGRPQDLVSAVPAVVLSGLAFGHAPPCREWPWFATGLLLLGTSLVTVAFLTLAGNFAVLPAVRGVTAKGVYRFVRHPAYLGEMILVLACCIAGVDPVAIAVFVVTIVAVVVRIRTEEGVLNMTGADASANYSAYCRTVRYRLLPGFW